MSAWLSPVEAGANVVPFLDMIAVSEIGPELLALSEDGYNVIVGSTPKKPILFDDYADHPNRLVRLTATLSSTAAGRYQILARYWPHYKALLGLPDFGPESQDRYAIQQLRERKALDLIHAGKVREAIDRCRNIWASLPGAGYGQHENEADALIAAYRDAGGSVA